MIIKKLIHNNNMKKNKLSKWLMTALLALPLGGNVAVAQVFNPCPEVVIDQRWDHTHSPICIENHWDTVAGCGNTVTLTAMPYIPVERFNGYYSVEQIPYNPPDTNFGCNPANNQITPGMTRFTFSGSDDDIFYGSATPLPGAVGTPGTSGYVPGFVFSFFGYPFTSFLTSSNGIITFNASQAGGSCPWSTDGQGPLPWTGSFASNTRLHNAIFGVYEDTHPVPGSGAYHNNAPYGVYQGVQDEFPCRKIILATNGITQYLNSYNANNRCTYQIVCYEGSNIIELHIKHRALSAYNNWNGQRGYIGIINNTGQPQQPTSTTPFVQSGAPAAFTPQNSTYNNYNPFTAELDTIAFRFTPRGTTLANCVWYRIFDDGRPAVQLRDETQFSDAVNDVDDPQRHGYCKTIEQIDNDFFPRRYEAQVKPDSTSRYVCKLLFYNAQGDLYDLSDTITIGVPDKDVRVYTTNTDGDTVKELNLCQSNAEANIRLQKPANQTLLNPITWQVTRVLNGVERQLPSSMYSSSFLSNSLHLNADPEYDTLPSNKIDSIWIRGFVEYTNRCLSSDSVLIRIYPIFDTFDVAGICAGQSYSWHGYTCTQTTNEPRFDTVSAANCDSIVYLHLTVFDISHTYDTVDTCAPIIWKDNLLHDHTNTSTIAIDTVIDKNLYDCDSIIHLVLTIYPVEAHLRASLQYFDFDNLDVVLNDLSTGNATRTWQFPSGPDQTGADAYWTMPTELDSADIRLIAHSQYGCDDTTNIVIPMNKENVWIPNAFMPDNPQGNNRFGTISKGTTKQEMYIYNRRGQLVFHCEGTDCTWDGRDGNGELCPQGAYVYLIRYVNKFNPEKTQVRKGTVTLIR